MTPVDEQRTPARRESSQEAALVQPELIAFRINTPVELDLVPAWQARAWIDATNQRFARRCLPLLMANQNGWFLINKHPVRLTWNGQQDIPAVRVEHLENGAPHAAVSHFGHGIVTWHVPYVFRTPPGWNLLARGPANWPKTGITPLEGLVETDWAVATFTMNWQMTAVELPVTFEAGEPVCMIVPQRRGELEQFQPIIRDMPDDPDLLASYREWDRSRIRFSEQLNIPGSPEAKNGWQRHYFRGTAPDGAQAPEHQTRLNLAEFDEPSGFCKPE